MSIAYRDEKESLVARIHELEKELVEQRTEAEALRRRAADRDAVRVPRWLAAMALLAAGAAGAGVVLGAGLGRAHAEPPAPPAPTPPPPARAASAPSRAGDPCATPGVRLDVDGEDAFAPAANDRDLAGHKYRRDGRRSPWFTVNGGPVYVHGVGGFLAEDTGATSLSLLTIMTKGDSAGYTLARGGRSLFEVTRSDGKLIAGRFEADVSRVADTTREPPFGTPVVRVRGTFCLPALPANPSDRGP